jgi:hypothetical protein
VPGQQFRLVMEFVAEMERDVIEFVAEMGRDVIEFVAEMGRDVIEPNKVVYIAVVDVCDSMFLFFVSHNQELRTNDFVLGELWPLAICLSYG